MQLHFDCIMQFCDRHSIATFFWIVIELSLHCVRTIMDKLWIYIFILCSISATTRAVYKSRRSSVRWPYRWENFTWEIERNMSGWHWKMKMKTLLVERTFFLIFIFIVFFCIFGHHCQHVLESVTEMRAKKECRFIRTIVQSQERRHFFLSLFIVPITPMIAFWIEKGSSHRFVE